MKMRISPRRAFITQALYDRCLSSVGRAQSILATYGITSASMGEDAECDVVVTFDRKCPRATFGWTSLAGDGATITIAAEKLDWPWVGDRLILLVLLHELGHSLRVPRIGPVVVGETAPHCTRPECAMTKPSVAGLAAVWAWIAARGVPRFCASCAAVLRGA